MDLDAFHATQRASFCAGLPVAARRTDETRLNAQAEPPAAGARIGLSGELAAGRARALARRFDHRISVESAAAEPR